MKCSARQASNFRETLKAMKPGSLHVIINPASAGGRTGKQLDNIIRAVRETANGECSFSITTKPSEATRLTATAIDRGCEAVLAVGGDGTIQEVVNGFFSNGHMVNPECQLGVLSNGTGQGFGQSLGVQGSLKAQLDHFWNGQVLLVDLGRVAFANAGGRNVFRYFLNECQAGIGGAVVKQVGLNHKALGGKVAFGYATLRTVFFHKNQSMTIRADGRAISGRFTGVVIANGAYTGGGMNLAPGAMMDDGYLDLLLMHEMTVVQRLQSFSLIYSGKHVGTDYFTYRRVKSVSLEASEPVLLEADGELLGAMPCSVEVIPRILPVRVPARKRAFNE